MKIKILPKIILNNMQKESELLELSIIESIYEIRKLKLAVFYGEEQELEVMEINSENYVFIEDFQIWIPPSTYVEVK